MMDMPGQDIIIVGSFHSDEVLGQEHLFSAENLAKNIKNVVQLAHKYDLNLSFATAAKAGELARKEYD